MGAKIGAFLGGTLGNQNTLEEKRDAGEAWGKEFFGGLQIESVADGSPAMKSGLLKGDRIKTVIYDIFKECTPKDIPELRACTKQFQTEDLIALYVQRGKQHLAPVIRLKENPIVNGDASSANKEAEKEDDFKESF